MLSKPEFRIATWWFMAHLFCLRCTFYNILHIHVVHPILPLHLKKKAREESRGGLRHAPLLARAARALANS